MVNRTVLTFLWLQDLASSFLQLLGVILKEVEFKDLRDAVKHISIQAILGEYLVGVCSAARDTACEPDHAAVLLAQFHLNKFSNRYQID
jgi:hypothetical protein